MKQILLFLLITYAAAKSHHSNLADNEDLCATKFCRAGRECLVIDGNAKCLCVTACPDRLKPVCGTDGNSYDNHCQLHQEACRSGEHIGIKHKGMCKKSSDKKWKKKDRQKLLGLDDLNREATNELDSKIDKVSKKSQKEPVICFSPQRNALRFLISTYFEENLKKQSWYSKHMGLRESLWGWYFSCNEERQTGLTSVELLACTRNVTINPRPGRNPELTKAMCVDAIITEGDKDKDFVLDFEEFSRIMDPKYQPEEKKCTLDGKNYFDGEVAEVGCNRCTCAIGNWACTTSLNCKDAKINKLKSLSTLPVSTDKIDNALYKSESPKAEIVADLWMEENKSAKIKAKKHKETKDKVNKRQEASSGLVSVKDEKTKLEKFHTERDIDREIDDLLVDLHEATKDKPNKKDQYIMQRALKEIRYLKRKTEELKSVIKKDKTSKKDRKDKLNYNKPESTRMTKNKENVRESKNKVKNDQVDEQIKLAEQHQKWMNLIDWGEEAKDIRKSSHVNSLF